LRFGSRTASKVQARPSSRRTANDGGRGRESEDAQAAPCCVRLSRATRLRRWCRAARATVRQGRSHGSRR
jgi:hypothetical protein